MTPPIPSSAKSRRPIGLLVILIGIPSVILIVLVVARVMLQFRVQSKVAAVRAEGLPMSGSELNEWLPEVNGADNGALILEKAFAQFRTFPDQRSNTVTQARLTNVWSAELHGMVQEFIQTNAPALALVDEALRRERFRFSVDYSPGLHTLLPHLAQVKKAATMLSLRTLLAMNSAGSSNNAGEWPAHFFQQIKLAESLKDEPTLIGHLVRIAALQMVFRDLEQGLSKSVPAAADCQEIQTALWQAAETNLMPQALIAERAISVPVFRMSWAEIERLADAESEPSDEANIRRAGSKAAGPFIRATGFFERDLNFYLETMDNAIALARKSSPESLGLTNHFEHASQTARSRFYILSGMVLPALSKAAVKDATAQVGLRMAATAMAVERFQQARGQLPHELKELVPDFLEKIPTDSFDGEPIRYTRLERGYRLYSVGPDGIDDEGRPAPKSKKFKDPLTWDLPFTVERTATGGQSRLPSNR